jgi:hypothetical protein
MCEYDKELEQNKFNAMKSIQDELSPPSDKDGWRLRNKYVYIQYDSPVKEKKLKEIINKYSENYTLYSLISDFSCIFAIKSEKQINCRDKSFFTITKIVPKILVLKNKTSFDKVLKNMAILDEIFDLNNQELAYWYKEYKANTLEEQVKGILECKTYIQAVSKYGKTYSDAVGIRNIWESKQAETRVKLDKSKYIRYNWHAEMWETLLAEEWNYRCITWIYDPPGGKDKTNFCKCFRSHHGGMYFKTASGSSNIANCIKEQLASGDTAKYILIDLPRASKTHKMWDTIECILDGEMTSTKYRGGCIELPQCRPVIFANWKPFDDDMMKLTKDLKVETEDYISKDRWKFGKIVGFTNHNGLPDFKIDWEENPFYDPKFEDKKPPIGTYVNDKDEVVWHKVTKEEKPKELLEF